MAGLQGVGTRKRHAMTFPLSQRVASDHASMASTTTLTEQYNSGRTNHRAKPPSEGVYLPWRSDHGTTQQKQEQGECVWCY